MTSINTPSNTPDDGATLLAVRSLKMQFGDKLIQQNVNFEVPKGCIFAIMGGSGCGKSTLLKHLVGLIKPAAGEVLIKGQDYWQQEAAQQQQIRQNFGMLFQGGALWTSMSVLDNVIVPLELKSPEMSASERRDKALELLSWVDMLDAAEVYPSALSGGMKKRAALARALAGNPGLLFLDEPSAGLDPINALRLDELILDIRERTGAAVLMVSHELESLLSIADDGIFLDAQDKQPIARGSPKALKDAPDTHPFVKAFLNRQEPPA